VEINHLLEGKYPVVKLMLRLALCAGLTLGAALMATGGELDRHEEATRVRESRFLVHPPTADARLYFEGALLKGTGLDREFRSPLLEEGKRFAYTVVAVWVENGREVTHEMHVAFWAGDDVVLNFRR
jgi:uncharacterized protein (TIGR03000 family)